MMVFGTSKLGDCLYTIKPQVTAGTEIKDEALKCKRR